LRRGNAQLIGRECRAFALPVFSITVIYMNGSKNIDRFPLQFQLLKSPANCAGLFRFALLAQLAMLCMEGAIDCRAPMKRRA
jgi:hypothetical protein